MKPKVLLAFDSGVSERIVTPDSWDRLCRVAEPIRPDRTTPYEPDELVEALQGMSGLMRRGNLVPHLTKDILDRAADLKVIGVWGDRFGHDIDVAAAEARGMVVIDTDNAASAPPVAEWDLAMMLVCLRNAGEVYRRMTEGTETWANTLNQDFVGGALTGRKVGLLGCGHVGQRLIELLEPFHVDLRVYDPYLDEETVARLGIVRAGLDETLQHAEILVVQVPLTPKTRGMIGERELGLLRKGAILINCCRGPVVEKHALIRKLERRELIAGLDVFDPEPLEPDSPLRRMPNVFITPHIAYYATNAFHRYFTLMVEEFERFFSGQPLRYRLTRRMVEIRNGRV